MDSSATITPRTQRRQEICQRRLDYLARNGERLLSSSGSYQSGRINSPKSPRVNMSSYSASAVNATKTATHELAKTIITAATNGSRYNNGNGAAQYHKPYRISNEAMPTETNSDEEALESEFHTHRPGPEFDINADYDEANEAADAAATSRSTELLVETQRNHLEDILQQSRRSAATSSLQQKSVGSSKRPHARSQSCSSQQAQHAAAVEDTNAFLHELELRHRMRQSRRLPDYDAILRQLDSELDSGFWQQPDSGDANLRNRRQQQQKTEPSAALCSPQSLSQQTTNYQQPQPEADYQKHLNAVKRHHEDLQRRVAEEWTEQRLRESNSRASLERYFASLREISPRSEAAEIAQQFEPVPDSLTDAGESALDHQQQQQQELIRCPDCGETSDACKNLSWCPECGCCLTVVINGGRNFADDKYWETVSNSTGSESPVSSTVTSLPGLRSAIDCSLSASQQRTMQRRHWQRELLSPELLRELRLDLPPE